MNRYLENAWLRNGLLLGALAAGGLLTQVMPTYEEMASLRNKPAAPSATSNIRDASTQGVTGVDVDQRRLRHIRRIS
jgi:hypothetical protein